MHRSAVKVNDASHNYNFKGKFNIYNDRKLIFVQNASFM